MGKIKFVCRKENGSFTERIFMDGEEVSPDDAKIADAQRFLHAFHPQDIVQKHADAYADFVLVFRTDDMQMEEFRDFLNAHEAAHPLI